MKETVKTSRTAGYLEKIFRALNAKYFGGQLEEPIITIQSTPRAYRPTVFAIICIWYLPFFLLRSIGNTFQLTRWTVSRCRLLIQRNRPACHKNKLFTCWNCFKMYLLNIEPLSQFCFLQVCGGKNYWHFVGPTSIWRHSLFLSKARFNTFPARDWSTGKPKQKLQIELSKFQKELYLALVLSKNIKSSNTRPWPWTGTNKPLFFLIPAVLL